MSIVCLQRVLATRQEKFQTMVKAKKAIQKPFIGHKVARALGASAQAVYTVKDEAHRVH